MYSSGPTHQSSYVGQPEQSDAYTVHPAHDPQWAEVRNQALERLQKMNANHAMHAWERRRAVNAIAAHGLAFLYWDIPGGGGRPHYLVVAAGTRLVHDEDSVKDPERLIYRLVRLAYERYLPAGEFDPRTTMANAVDPMSEQARFLGIGLSTLDTPTATWESTQKTATGPHEIPGRCYLMLQDGTRIIVDRQDDRQLGQVRVTSTGELNIIRGNPSRVWEYRTEIPQPADLWEWLRQLGEACAKGEQLADQRVAATTPRQRRGTRTTG